MVFLFSSSGQNLPPFFAILAGPTFSPYRMEELELILGRHSFREREADVHLGNDPQIASAHVTISYERDTGKFHAVNLADGFRLKEAEEWKEYSEIGARVALPNPAVLSIGGCLVYFQLFHIIREEVEVKELRPPPVPAQPKPVTVKPIATSKAPSTRTSTKGRKGGRPYAEMIEEALRQNNGQGTYKEITAYIAANFKDDVRERKTWRNSVGGILSSNAAFVSGAPPSGKGKDSKRGRGSIWYLVKDKGEVKNPSKTPSSDASEDVVDIEDE